MNEFLKMIAEDLKHTDKCYTSDDFYVLLKYLGITKDSSKVEDIENFYQEFLKSLNNSLVKYHERVVSKGENATHYIGFYVDRKADYKEALKVYFPVKYEYMISALKTVFLYLIRNNIEAVVKFHVKATNEGIVIRFYNTQDVMPFINYCNNEFILKDLLEELQPFMNNVYGLGIVKDDNSILTYNKTLSMLLEEYFNIRKNDNNLDLVGELDFLDYVIKRGSLEGEEIIKFDIESIENNIRKILNQESPL